MGNVLDKLPKSLLPTAKKQLQEIWMAPMREQAYEAFDYFIECYQAKHPKAAECLQKDKEELLAFYDFPAEHWVHIRTANPIESTFSMVRHRTYKSKGAFSRTTIFTMVFKLCENTQKHWYQVKGFNYLADVIHGVKFVNGTREVIKNELVNEGITA
jgi:putative transposase